ncbi:MAG: ABC transporter substrate-binding protein [Kiritimatiellae bacterium]|nr:ABC transporter substrate-binding protein [Kiritimatiellia bacterium]
MKKNKLLIAIGAVVLIGIVSLLAYKATNKSAPDDVIRIGAILPLTGSVSVMGQEIFNSIKIAEQKLEGRFGNEQPFELIVEDGRYTSKDTVLAFARLLQMKRLKGVLAFGNTPVSQFIPRLNEEHMPLVAFGTGASDVTKLSDLVFRAWIPVALQAKVMAKYAHDILKINRIAVFAINDQSGDDAISIFKSQYGKDGVVYPIERFDISDVDVKAQIMKLVDSKPDAIFITGFGPAYISSLNYLKECRFSGKILTEISLVASDQRSHVKDLSNIIFLDTEFGVKINTPERIAFVNEYSRAYGREPTIVGAFAYEALMLYNEAYKNAKSSDKLIEGFRRISKYHSIVGEISYDSQGEIFFPLIVVGFDSNGQEVVLDEEIGQNIK